MKLSDTLLISPEEAQELIERYFTTFPAIKHFLETLGSAGTSTGMIRTYPPYQRIRWFEHWRKGMERSRVKEDRVMLGKIERASKNSPVQGTAADMTKEALILIRRYIKTHQVPVRLVMTVHDQVDTICHRDYAPQWQQVLQTLMEKAARRILTSGLLKAETTVSDCWQK